jgi:hypothetical protein
VRKPEGKRPTEASMEDGIRMDLREIAGVEWIKLAQDSVALQILLIELSF